MKLKSVVAILLSLFLTKQGYTEDHTANTVVPVDEKIVELHITFAPPPNAEVKKQRKTLLVKAGKAICSGAFVTPLGHIITAKHCAEGAEEITAITSDGQEYSVTRSFLSKTQDLAVLQIGKLGSPYFELAENPVKRGDPVWIIGSPLGLTGNIAQGIVSKLGGDMTFMDCTALPGNSGGPVLDAEGKLVGVVSAMVIVIAGPSHLSIAMSLDAIKFFFYELMTGQ